MPNATATPSAVIFDLDGVLTDTAELHYQSWQCLMDDLEIPFDRRINEALRGLSRLKSLEIVLGDHAGRFTEEQRQRIAARKNEEYLRRVARMTPNDVLPGVLPLLNDLRARGVRIAVASSSRNAGTVIDCLGIRGLLDALADGNDVPQSKPAPDVFLKAAERLGITPERCVVVEDAEAGVRGARAAGMKVVGIGPAERVGEADLVVATTAELTVGKLAALVAV